MQVCPATGKLRLARATPYFNNIEVGQPEGWKQGRHAGQPCRRDCSVCSLAGWKACQTPALQIQDAQGNLVTMGRRPNLFYAALHGRAWFHALGLLRCTSRGRLVWNQAACAVGFHLHAKSK
jgi:hypothetical protein